jgi:hypothetical protein
MILRGSGFLLGCQDYWLFLVHSLLCLLNQKDVQANFSTSCDLLRLLNVRWTSCLNQFYRAACFAAFPYSFAIGVHRCQHYLPAVIMVVMHV